MSLHQLLYVAVFGLAALSCFASLPRLAAISDAATRRGLQGLVLTSGGWAAAHVGFLLSPMRELALAWYVAGLLLGFAAVGAWLYFCSAYTGRTYHRNRRYRRFAVAIYLVLAAVKLTNPWHHAYYTTTAVATPFPHLAVYTQPLHWVAMGLAYALAFVGYFLLFEMFTDVDLDTRALLGLVALTGLPVVVDFVGYTTPFLLDITYEPLGVAVFAVAVAFVYLDRLDAVQVAGERDTPIISLDARNRIRDVNQAAREQFPVLNAALNQPLHTTLPEVALAAGSNEPVRNAGPDGTARWFRVTETPYATSKAGLDRTLVFRDVTERERYRRELEQQSERPE